MVGVGDGEHPLIPNGNRRAAQVRYPVFRDDHPGVAARGADRPVQVHDDPAGRPAVDGSAMMGTPPGDRAAPRRKSLAPPTEPTYLPPATSALTCPDRSTSHAELIAASRHCAASTAGSWV